MEIVQKGGLVADDCLGMLMSQSRLERSSLSLSFQLVSYAQYCFIQPSATHPPRFDKPAFSRFSQIFQPRLVVHSFGKIVKRQVCRGVSCRRLLLSTILIYIFIPHSTEACTHEYECHDSQTCVCHSSPFVGDCSISKNDEYST